MCKIKLAKFLLKPDKFYCLKIFNKQILRGVKEYRRKKQGRGMEICYP